MSAINIFEEIKIELSNLELIVKELSLIKEENKFIEPSLRDKTAAGSFLAQFYNGIENILKRMSRLTGIEFIDKESQAKSCTEYSSLQFVSLSTLNCLQPLHHFLCRLNNILRSKSIFFH